MSRSCRSMLLTLRSICRKTISEISLVAAPSCAMVSGELNSDMLSYSSARNMAAASMPKRTKTVWATLVMSSTMNVELISSSLISARALLPAAFKSSFL
ncbi:MAG: hypothetical protein ACLSH5_05210 [Christensenellales bacterium]